MFNDVSRIRNIDIPENLFSNLGEINQNKKIVESKPHIEKKEINNDDEGIKLTNLSNKNEYRKRIDKMYNEIKDLKPIDGEIDEVIYFNNYIEKGIVVKPKISSLKQFWTEYRLISNEKNSKKQDKNPLENFDELFNKLSIRVEEINNYIEELKEMRNSINLSNSKLEEEKNKLEEEKQDFIEYKKSEEIKINKEKENIKINYDRLQTIINDLDKKLTGINN